MFFHWFGDFSTSRISQVLPGSSSSPIPPPMAKIFPFATTEANLKSYKKFTILLITITVNKTKKYILSSFGSHRRSSMPLV